MKSYRHPKHTLPGWHFAQKMNWSKIPQLAGSRKLGDARGNEKS
jgi:hypothetical protein